jgi:multiple sugar transport system substrate-binding protein
VVAHVARRRLVLVGGACTGGAPLAACGAGAGGLLAAVALGCGATGPGESAGSGGGAGGVKAAGTPEFWQWGTVYNDGFQQLVDEFNAKQTGVRVNFVPGATQDYWNKVTAALAGNVGPDVFLMNGVNALAWAYRKQVRDLSDLQARDKAAGNDLRAVVKAFTEFYQTGGKLMGWPWDFSASVTAYNVDHMKEAGLKTPGELGDGWDWTALADHARKLHQPGQRWAFFSNRSIETGWLNYVVGHGGAFLTADRKRCVIGSPEAIEATQFLVDLIHKQRVAPTTDELTAVGGQVDGFIAGKLSIGTYGDWSFSDFIKKSQGATWDVTFIAKSPKLRKTANMTNFRGLVMNPASKQVEASWAFMTHLLTKPVQDRVPPLFNECPARQDSADEVYASAEKVGPPPGRRLLKESIRATQPLPTHDVVTWTDQVAVFNPILNDVFDGKVAVKDGLTKMQDEVNALYQRSGT